MLPQPVLLQHLGLRSAALCITAEGLTSCITLNTTLLPVLFISSFFVCPLHCFLLLLLSVSILTPEEDNFLSKAFAYYCLLVFHRIGEYISLDLFCSFLPVIYTFCSLSTARLKARPRTPRDPSCSKSRMTDRPNSPDRGTCDENSFPRCDE